MSELDYHSAQNRTDSKIAYVNVPIGTMATVTGSACDISAITPSQRAARRGGLVGPRGRIGSVAFAARASPA